MSVRDYSWSDYGISKERKKELGKMAQKSQYKYAVRMSAYITAPYIAEWLIESVSKHKTYELIEFDAKLGHIPCGRTDFYAHRRRFYNIFRKILEF